VLNNREPLVDFEKVKKIIVSEDKAFVELYKEDEEMEAITDAEWLEAHYAGFLTTDKNIISADGEDTAVITIETSLSEVTFYLVNTGEKMATLPVVDGVCHMFFSSTKPGEFCVRAGILTDDSRNEVTIFAN
jgi:hypothetical protein